MRPREPNFAVQALAALFMAVVCVALVGLDLMHTWAAHDGRVDEAKVETNNLARSLAQHVQDEFESTDAVLKGLQLAVEVEGTGPAAIVRLQRRLRARVANQQLLHGLFLFDLNGDWITGSLPDAAFDKVRTLNYADRDFFRWHRDHDDGAVLIGPPIQAKFDGAWVVTLSRRMNSPDGSFAGVVDASIGIDRFQSFFDKFDIGERGAITLLNANGRIIVRRPFDATNVGRDVSRSEFYQHTRNGGEAGSLTFTSLIDSVPRIGSFHRVAGFDLMVMVTFDTEGVLAVWRHEAKVHLVWLAITVLLIATLGYRLMLQIRDRLAAEGEARALRIEAYQRGVVETERRAHEKELEVQKGELERSNAALEQFAYAASHDLQSPLRAIAHLAEWIEADVRPTACPETIDHLKLMNGRVARLQMLISGLLEYARVGSAKNVAEDVDVAAAVQDVVEMLEPRLSFAIGCTGEMTVIRTCRTPFMLVLKNLISNALQHHDRASGQVTVSMQVADGMAEFRVSDDGPGIPSQYHEKIFVIFKTLRSRDEKETGGIGLAMVKRQIGENGGIIRVESAPPVRGSSFVFTWKLAPAEGSSGSDALTQPADANV